MICIEKISYTHVIVHVENRKIQSFFLFFEKYSNARYIMFDKLFALVELSFVDTHTLLWVQNNVVIQTANFFSLFIYLLTCHTDLPQL